ncbi:MAG: gluconate 2-dehydrogenase subunit 3 family protein [Saprospiraceae bacterium]|nr:gluconate 2-dehydrogenase subunit 3 family protein [Saprospiraceae bacterium]
MDRREAIKKTMLITGYALTASTVQAVLTSCETEREVNWTPKYFSAEQAALITNMAETILPRTKTPGAIDVGVPAFMERMVKDTYLPEDQEQFAAGLADVEARAQKAHGKPFVACKIKQQANILEALDAEASAAGIARRDAVRNNPELGAEPYFNFFLNFKSLALLGYFTSSFVGTKVLSYDPIPGAYLGCIPAKEVGNAWSL